MTAIFHPLACHVRPLLSQMAIHLRWFHLTAISIFSLPHSGNWSFFCLLGFSLRLTAIFFWPCSCAWWPHFIRPCGCSLWRYFIWPCGRALQQYFIRPCSRASRQYFIQPWGRASWQYQFFSSQGNDQYILCLTAHGGSSTSWQSLICFLCITVICFVECYIYPASHGIVWINIQSALWQHLMEYYICLASQPCPSGVAHLLRYHSFT